jgi:HSP20 family molecular chaperone IbpA
MTNLALPTLFNELSSLSGVLDSTYPSRWENPRNLLNYQIDSGDEFATVEVEVPGVEPSDIKVRIEGRSLSVNTPRGSAFFTIGQRIDAEGTKADLKNGLLTLKIPKREAKIVEVNVHIDPQ